MDEGTSSMLSNMMTMNILMNYKTGIIYIDMLCSILFIFIIPYILNNFNLKIIRNGDLINNILNITKTKNTVEIIGKQTIISNSFQTRTETLFSTRFRAIWNHININNKTSDIIDIYKVKEYADSENSCDYFGEPLENDTKDLELDVFVVDQPKSFKLDDNIMCRVLINNEKLEKQTNGNSSAVNLELIHLYIYSYKYNIKELLTYVDKISLKYIEKTYHKRLNNLYIYTFLTINQSKDDSKTWNECPFSTYCSFNNLFFDTKQQLLDKLNYFKNNKLWYQEQGIPYTLGIGLHGPPGTGKTSVIKCIAQMMKRHLIIISLSKIKTRLDFYKVYFENTYNSFNKKNSIIFDKKIIVFEDIDCMGDIIKQRKHDKDKAKPGINNKSNEISKEDLLTAVVNGIKKEDDDSLMSLMKNDVEDDKITLDFILNIIDGIRETPGRILIITSNFYNKIDKALTRPGRIDIDLLLDYASISSIKEMYQYYYNEKLSDGVCDRLKDKKITPATLVNLRVKSNNKEEFIEKLLLL